MPKCTECREQISSGANICPYCQSKVYTPDFGDILWMVRWVALVIFVICLIGARGNVLEAIYFFWSAFKGFFSFFYIPLSVIFQAVFS